ncbi:MAG: AzlD domain-containing protein [Clostridia bacterium]|nr:AzlD domain-containing protein [Clostridia bacterium]
MGNNAHAMLLILTMTAGTVATRFLPFLLLGDKRQTPPFITYLGKVLPYAIMGMLVVYCLKGVSVTQLSSVLPALLGVGITAGLHLWKHNTLLSILGGTAVYMLLVQLVF